RLFPQRHRADLPDEAESIEHKPLLCNLASSNAIDRDPSKRHSLAGRWDTHELSLVCSRSRVTRHYLIPFGDDIFHGPMEIRKGSQEPHEVPLALHGVNGLPVNCELGTEESLSRLNVPLIDAISLNRRINALFSSTDIHTPPSHPS